MTYRILLLVWLLASGNIMAQNSSAEQKIADSYEQRNQLAKESILKNYPVRNVGPTVMGGRVSDIAVNPQHTDEFYVAYASGGVFKTVNNGITFESVYQDIDALGIGDIALSPSNPQIIYVGTGEKNSSRSSYAGSGVYKSTDGGKTWQNLGLSETHHISRIIVHPSNPDKLWVASLGALYSHEPNRGVYYSENGGKSWNKTLFVNDSTGVVDLVINPKNPDQLWAATWERTRKAWDFKGNGGGSAIYRSDDGGKSWTKKTQGFPQGNFVGRIGLDVAAQAPSTLYAVLDNQKEEKQESGSSDDRLNPSSFLNMSVSEVTALDNKKLDRFLRSNRFPEKYTSQVVKSDLKNGKYKPADIANYSGDANEALFETSITGTEVYRSDDGGENWVKVNTQNLGGVYFTYGYYFGETRVNPANKDQIYIFGVPLLKSNDGGKTFARIDTIGNVHVDHQALWIDPSNPKHLLLGNDGGLYQSYDEGANWLHLNNVTVGQFYTVNVDNEKPYNIYGGLQDNGVFRGSSKSVPNRSKEWENLFGGDGMFVTPDPRNSNLIYTGFQFGNYYRVDMDNNDYKAITPAHNIGEPTLRFNWRTPVILSHHNPDIVYFGAQRLYRSLNQGNDWEAVSEDLTKDLPNGNVPYSTITTIEESPLSFSLLYVGTDDGNVQVSSNSGGTWSLINKGLPVNKWVSSLHASNHDQNVVYVSLNGYREDDFNTYVFKSKDQGKTWQSIKGNLPEVVINVIRQDPVNPSLLYLGTDHGTYFSFDDGAQWHLMNNLLNVASYDMLVHPRENELVVGTHGRSIYVVDVKPLQKLDIKTPVVVMSAPDIRFSSRWNRTGNEFEKRTAPSSSIMYYTKAAGNTGIEIYSLADDAETLIARHTIDAVKGINSFKWDLKGRTYTKKGKPSGEWDFVKKGKYKVVLSTGSASTEKEFEVK